MKLAIGTAQFGLDYGFSQRSRKTPVEELPALFEFARQNGVSILDTAASYGQAEEALGQSLPQPHSFRIVTKTHAEVRATFERSLEKLRQKQVYGLLVHEPSILTGADGKRVMEAMIDLKAQGKVTKIGVSVYTGEELDEILSRFQIDLVQLPVSVLDQRLIQGGQLARLKKLGVEIHARSVFLQGVLLRQPGELPAHFSPIKPHLERYHALLKSRGWSPAAAAYGFVASLGEVDQVICGLRDRRQLEELVTAARQQVEPGLFGEFAVSKVEILNPRLWPKPTR